jgi:hypothetical protein
MKWFVQTVRSGPEAYPDYLLNDLRVRLYNIHLTEFDSGDPVLTPPILGFGTNNVYVFWRLLTLIILCVNCARFVLINHPSLNKSVLNKPCSFP